MKSEHIDELDENGDRFVGIKFSNPRTDIAKSKRAYGWIYGYTDDVLERWHPHSGKGEATISGLNADLEVTYDSP